MLAQIEHGPPTHPVSSCPSTPAASQPTRTTHTAADTRQRRGTKCSSVVASVKGRRRSLYWRRGPSNRSITTALDSSILMAGRISHCLIGCALPNANGLVYGAGCMGLGVWGWVYGAGCMGAKDWGWG